MLMLSQLSSDTATWVLGIIATITSSAVITMLGVVVKKFDALTIAVQANTQAIEIMKVEFKRVDDHDDTISKMKPRLDEVYYWGKRKGMQSSEVPS